MWKTSSEDLDHHESGLTLLEVLVSLVLIALISIFIVSGTQLGNRIWILTNGIENNSVIAPVQSLLSSSLEKALPVFSPKSGLNGSIEFVGTGKSLRYIVNRRGHVTIGGLHVIEIFVAEGQEHRYGSIKQSLKIHEYLYRPKQQAQKKARKQKEERSLLTKIEKMSFQYFGADETNTKSKWQNDWSDRKTLPELVSISIQFPKGDPRRWPKIVVPLRLR